MTINHKKNLFFVIPFSLTLVVINFIRILKVPVTHDEPCYSPKASYRDIFFDRAGFANNHVLHSALRKFFIECFGDTLFFLRFDSFLAHIVFIIFSYLLCKQLFKSNFWLLGSFVILNIISPFLFEFWGLSRGYGLAMCCMTVSVYFLLVFESRREFRFLIWSLFAGMLSVLANYSLLNYFIALSGTIVIGHLIFKSDGTEKAYKLKAFSIVATAVILLTLFIAGSLTRVYNRGEIAYLGSKGFIEDTVKSLANCCIYNNQADAPVEYILVYFSIITVPLILLYQVVIYFKKRSFAVPADIAVRYGITLSLLILLPACSVIAQHLLFNINYITDRAAVFLILLFLFQLLYFLYYLKAFVPKISAMILTFLVIMVAYNFVTRINTGYTWLWWYDKDDMFVLNRMAQQQSRKKEKIKVCISWLFDPSFSYDIRQYFNGRYDALTQYNGDKITDSTFDYIYIETGHWHNVPQCYIIDTTAVYSAFILCKKKDTTLPAAK